MIVTPVSAIAGDDRAVDRRGAAPARQQRRVDVDHARAAESPAARRAGSGRRPRRRRGPARSAGHSSRNASSSKPLRLQHRQRRRRWPPALVGVGVQPAGRGPAAGRAATPRPTTVWRRREQRRQRRHRELRRAEERRCAAAARSPFAGALQLLDLAHDQVALDAAQAVDEDSAVEVIHLVLEARARAARRPSIVCVLPCDRARVDLARAGRTTVALNPGTLRQPSSSSCMPSRSTNRGLIITMQLAGIACRPEIDRRRPAARTPTCGAASPTPGAAYIVSIMSSIRRCRSWRRTRRRPRPAV